MTWLDGGSALWPRPRAVARACCRTNALLAMLCGAITILAASPDSAAAQGTVAAADAAAAAGSAAEVAVSLALQAGTVVATLQFNLTVVPEGDAPALTTAVSFAPDVMAPSLVIHDGNSTLLIGWLTPFAPPLAGTLPLALGTLGVPIPDGACARHSYRVEVREPSATSDGTTDVPITGDAGLVVVETPCPPTTTNFLLYKVKPTSDSPKFVPFAPVTLADQFRVADYQVVKPKFLGLPASKNGEGIMDAVTHLEDYQVQPVKGSPKFGKLTNVEIANQCNTLRLEVSKPASILVPSLKSLVAPPPAPEIAEHQLDHYLCYKATPQAKLADGTKLPKFPKGIQVVVADQFQTQTRRYDLKKITRLCTPVDKSGNPALVSGPNKGQPFPITPSPIRHPSEHLVCYQAKLAKALIPQTGCGPTTPGDFGTKIVPAQVKHVPVEPVLVNNQFGPEVLETVQEAEFCIPSTKVILPP